MSKATTKLAMHDLIDRSAVSRERMTVMLYKMQTADEKSAGTASHDNGVGFNGTDAFIMSSFAEQILRAAQSKRAEGTRLSARQHEIAGAKLKKYWAQLARYGAERGWTPTLTGEGRPMLTLVA